MIRWWSCILCCIDVNECETLNGGCQQTCTNTDGSFSCDCTEGYELEMGGTTCQGKLQLDWSRNTIVVTAFSQYKLLSCIRSGENLTWCLVPEHPENICALSTIVLSISALPANMCGNQNMCEQNCVSLDGTEVCSCDVGFTLAENNASCLDMNECNASPAICDQLCNNTNGSFVCDCDEGYRLGPNGRSCIGINYKWHHLTNYCTNSLHV